MQSDISSTLATSALFRSSTYGLLGSRKQRTECRGRTVADSVGRTQKAEVRKSTAIMQTSVEFPVASGDYAGHIASSSSASDRGLRLFDYGLWVVREPGEKLLHVFAGGGIDVDINLLRVGQELVVAHGRLERLAQDGEPLLRQIGRGGERPTKRDLVEM